MANGIGKKVDLAKELIIREIWSMGLRSGEKLPSCDALSRRMNLGKATVFRAVKELQEEGILESRDRVGVFISDPQTPGHAGYQVGLIMGNMNASSFNNLLSVYLQSRCTDRGCWCLMFPASKVLHDTSKEDSLSAHVGVRQQIERSEIQGLLTQISFSEENKAFLKEHGIPYCFVGGFSTEENHLSVVLSMKKVISMGIEKLKNSGCKRPLALIPFGVWKTEAEQLIRNFGGSCRIYSSAGDMFSLAKELSKMPERDRPDGILIPDEEEAYYFCAAVFSAAEFRMPHLVVLAPEELQKSMQTTRRLPLPEDTDILTFSVQEMTEKAIDLLIKNMKCCSQTRQEEEVRLYWNKNVNSKDDHEVAHIESDCEILPGNDSDTVKKNERKL